eukprot:XP_011672987.1 PREDICTED: uncharacterized protein LOC100889978 [Strongylocentrotus purpuratus]
MPRKHQGFVKKRKGFNGTRWDGVKRAKKDDATVPLQETASERKLRLNNAPAAQKIQPCPTHKETRHVLEGYYLISGPLLTSALKEAHVCPGGHLIPLEDTSQRHGLRSFLILQCSVCKAEHSFLTSENIFKGKRPGTCSDINRRAVLAASEVGLGRVGLADLTSILGLPPPPVQKSYQRHLKAIAKAIDTVRNIIQVFVKRKISE